MDYSLSDIFHTLRLSFLYLQTNGHFCSRIILKRRTSNSPVHRNVVNYSYSCPGSSHCLNLRVIFLWTHPLAHSTMSENTGGLTYWSR